MPKSIAEPQAETETNEASGETAASAWMPAPRGEPVVLGGGAAAREEPEVPRDDQPQSKVHRAADDKQQRDEVTAASEESFPASDPPSFQPSST